MALLALENVLIVGEMDIWREIADRDRDRVQWTGRGASSSLDLDRVSDVEATLICFESAHTPSYNRAHYKIGLQRERFQLQTQLFWIESRRSLN